MIETDTTTALIDRYALLSFAGDEDADEDMVTDDSDDDSDDDDEDEEMSLGEFDEEEEAQ